MLARRRALLRVAGSPGEGSLGSYYRVCGIWTGASVCYRPRQFREEATVTLYAEKLAILRAELYAAAQRLEGRDLDEFWELIDELQKIREFRPPSQDRDEAHEARE